MLGTLRALERKEERELAGELAGTLYLTGAVTVTSMLLLPGVVTRHWAVVIVVAAFGLAWGIACFVAIPWQRAHPLVSHFSTAMGFPITAAAMAATGGAMSPARFYLFFIVVYCAYFYPRREAIAYCLACGGVLALPLLYDGQAIEHQLLGELLIAGPAYLVLAAIVIAGKEQLVELRERAESLAMRDELTGLANRRALLERMNARVGREPAGLLLLDLDGFKDANTAFGHPVGDRILRETARSIARAARETDTVARLGGDEFAVFAVAAAPDGMRGLAARVLDEVRRGAAGLDLPGLSLTASVGWALSPTDAETVEELVAVADFGMRTAKAGGKDRSQSPLDWLPEPLPA